MAFSKDEYQLDLKPYTGRLRLVPYVTKYKWTVLFANLMTDLLYKGKDIKGLDCQQVFIPSRASDVSIRARIYRPEGNHENLPVMLYLHGGGYMLGCPEQAEGYIKSFIDKRPCVVVAPAYRKSHTQPFPGGFNDCYDSLLWVKQHAAQLGVRADKFIVAGHSAGGGLTAAITLKARDTGDFHIAFQMPFYPMIDDQQPQDAARNMNTPVWNTMSNANGWRAYLANLDQETTEVSVYAAPARNKDYSNFPPTISFVGDKEPFYQETLDYVQALDDENIDVKFKVYPGCFHAFDLMVPKADISKDALKFTYQAYAEFYDKYIGSF